MGARHRRRVSASQQGKKTRDALAGAAQVFRSMANEITGIRQEVQQLRGLLDVMIEATGCEAAVTAVLEARAAALEVAKLAGGPPPDGVVAGPPVSLVGDSLPPATVPGPARTNGRRTMRVELPDGSTVALTPEGPPAP